MEFQINIEEHTLQPQILLICVGESMESATPTSTPNKTF